MSTNTSRCDFCIASLDRDGLELWAQYNPKELQYDRAVTWTPHPKDGLEYGGTQGRSLTVELFFDGYEDDQSVAPQCDLLETLATVIDPDSYEEADQRPHYCLATWGNFGLPVLRCVVESVSTKYTMFSRGGTPLRATCTVKLKEADVLSKDARQGRAKNRR